MNSNLTRVQRRALCQELGGGVKLTLLFKASIHGFTGAAFHQRCDTRGPSVSVGYNSSGYVFGGYTNAPSVSLDNLSMTQRPFSLPSKETSCSNTQHNNAYAVKMISNCGPYFGEALVLMNGAEMHGNDLQLIECEVYQVEETTELEKPWRVVAWDSQRRKELMDSVSKYEPLSSAVSQVRVLLVGPVGAGKSSFFNSINSVFRGYVTSQAMAGCSATSLTTQMPKE
ncbi:hypothetical protein WMY93_033735 [Mugilogobius chulae]|uniref:TLDc domain-containing protein n=1 Tax=Mugilogobius chulae TaxID=88201 RepID=A0AAW0MK72_9GOBI